MKTIKNQVPKMKQTTGARRTLFSRAVRLIGMLVTTELLLVGAAKLQAQTPLYQWNFNGGSGTGIPSVEPAAGGGTLSTFGTGSFTGVGATGAGTDWTYVGLTANDGCKTATANISGLGTISNLTLTFWINPSVAYASQSSTLARLLMLGNATTYDEGAGNASPGFSLALNNSGSGLQYNINNGSEPVQANVFPPTFTANQWVFVVMEYDGLAATNLSSALGAAIGNSSGNLAFITGTTTASIGLPVMENLNAGFVSPGPLTNTATMALMVGNRASGGRGFQGRIDNINIYTNLLTLSQLESLRISGYATTLTAGILSSTANPVAQGTTVILAAVAGGGTAPYSYQWQTDGGGGGTLTNVPGATFATFTNNTTAIALGNYTYQVVVTDSTTTTVTTTPLVVNVNQILSGTLTDLGANAPTPGGSDAYQLNSAFTYQANGGLNYYDDASPASGQTFNTGSNVKGYSMNSVAIEMAGGSSGTPFVASGAGSSAGMTNQAYDLRIYSIAGSTAIQIADVTNLLFSFANGHWIQWNFPSVVLTNNATYAYTLLIRNTANWCGMSTSDGLSDHYTGGQMVGIPTGGGTVTYSSSIDNDGTFDVSLVPNGVPFFLAPATATPNPAYALSPVNMSDVPVSAGAYTYHWFTDDGTGANPPNMISIPGATATNLTVVPQDLNPGGADYATNYYFVATRIADSQSVTSSVVALTIHAASAPLLTGPAPTNLVTFAGSAQTYNVTEAGTLPITNNWQFNNGGGFVSLTLRTNITLTLTNLQTISSGTYRFVATNRMGNSSSAVTLTVLPAPAAPVAASQKYFNMVYTNNPWAYWRLNETNDPTVVGAPAYAAYDYSGHGFLSTYGNAVTVNNAGPQPPAFPGFDANELAAGTSVSIANANLTAPALNLTGNSNVTFMAWINPASGGQAGSTGLLFNRGGPDSACGFGFGSASDELGYTWNNNSASTYNWSSALYVADNQWNFVAYVITPTNATVYLGNLNGGTTNFLQANNPIAHTAETFAGGTVILGGDSQTINRSFNGLITEASLLTNALTSAQVQQYFLVGIGAQQLMPTIPATTVAPVAATGSGVYSGQNVRLTAVPVGTAPLSLQWQASPDDSTWTNVPGATASTLLVNPFTVGAIYYQLAVTNAAGAGTNVPVLITFNALPAYPNGLWTANFQETNNIGAGQSVGGGVGHYVGRGILGSGIYWNVLPHVLTSGFSAGTITNVTDFLDDGVTHSGISCQMNSGGSYNSLGASLPNSSDIGNLLDQFFRTYYSPNALQFFGVPNGTYNLTCYAGNGVTSEGANNYGSTFVVYDPVNGNQTNSTAEASPITDALSEGVNFVTFTNVHVSGGTLNVDVDGNVATGGSAIIESAQIQLVSYDPPVAAFSGTPTSGVPPLTVAFTNSSTGSVTNSVWTFGDGGSVTNTSTAGVTHSYANPGTYTVILAVIGPGGTSSATNTGYITVNSAVITPITISKGSMQINGSDAATFTFTNAPGLSFSVRATNNLTAPVATWPVVGAPVESPAGTYRFTDANKATNATRFYIISQP